MTTSTSSSIQLKTIAVFLLTFSVVYGQNEPTPKGYELIKEVFGDLDNDGVDERVCVFNTNSTEEEENEYERELIIFKMDGEKWAVWKCSSQSVYGSSEGGMKGDPFQGLEIVDGALKIFHFGGTSWIWSHVDIYKFRNEEFELVSYSSSFGRPCDEFTSVNFNLISGSVVVEKDYEDCEIEDRKIVKQENEEFEHHLQERILLQSRREKEFVIESPKYKHVFYL